MLQWVAKVPGKTVLTKLTITASRDFGVIEVHIVIEGRYLISTLVNSQFEP